LSERKTTVESCPTSTEQTSGVAPIAEFLRAGVPVTVNTDNPCISNVTMSSEMERVIKEHGLTLAEVEQLLENGLEGAFLSPRERALLGARMSDNLSTALEGLVEALGPAGLCEILKKTLARHNIGEPERTALERILNGMGEK
ncbi:hypothetical protein ACFL6C_07295, partial [Myxococcota bacterium]